MTLAIVADAAEVFRIFIYQEDVRAEIDLLAGALQASTDAREISEVHRWVDRDEDVGILRNRFLSRERAQERNAPHTTAGARRPHEREHGAQ
jgi:hypothetical protein